MKRREFIAGLGGVAAGCAVAVPAAKDRIVGRGHACFLRSWTAAFVQRLGRGKSLRSIIDRKQSLPGCDVRRPPHDFKTYPAMCDLPILRWCWGGKAFHASSNTERKRWTVFGS